MSSPSSPSDVVDVPVNDLGPLAWVIDELRKSLEAANKALKRFSTETRQARESDLAAADPAALRVAKHQLHQAVGALEMVGFNAPASVLRGMEAAVQRFISRPAQCTDVAIQKVERAGFALIDYLESVLANKSISPVALFPQYRDVQELAGAQRIHPADLWDAPIRTSPLPWPVGLKVSALVMGVTVREQFDRYVLHVIKKLHPVAGAQLRQVCAGLAAGQAAGAQRQFWMVAAAYFEGVEHGLLSDDVYVKRAASRVLLQYTALAQGKFDVSSSLVHDLLFFVAHAAMSSKKPTPWLDAVRAAYGLLQANRLDYERPVLGRHDPAAVAQARKRINAAKESWSLLTGGDSAKARQVVDQFGLVTNSLQKLFPHAEGLSKALLRAVDTSMQPQGLPGAELGMEVATAILYLEAVMQEMEPNDPTLDGRLKVLEQRIRSAHGGSPSAPLEPWMEELYRRVSDRHTMGSVVDELKVSLAELERQLDQFFRDPEHKDVLVKVPQQLVQMRGVLSVLGLDHASQAVQRMRASVEEILVNQLDVARARETGTFSHLANNLSALSFLIDMLNYQPTLAKRLFVFDSDSGELKPLMGRSSAPARSEVEAETVAASVERVVQQVEEGADLATLTLNLDQLADDAALADQIGVAQAARDAAAAVVTQSADVGAQALANLVSTQEQEAEPVALAAAPAAQLQDEPEVEDDLRDIFLEEARDVLQAGQAAIAALRQSPQSATDMTTLRRAFHTLKGSSRMVGLNEFGEAAWALEQVLNTWLADNRPASPDFCALSGDAMDRLSAWVEDIERHADGRWRAEPFRQSALALRNQGQLLPIAADLAAPVWQVPSEAAQAAEPPVVSDPMDAAGPSPVAESVQTDEVNDPTFDHPPHATEWADTNLDDLFGPDLAPAPAASALDEEVSPDLLVEEFAASTALQEAVEPSETLSSSEFDGMGVAEVTESGMPASPETAELSNEAADLAMDEASGWVVSAVDGDVESESSDTSGLEVSEASDEDMASFLDWGSPSTAVAPEAKDISLDLDLAGEAFEPSPSLAAAASFEADEPQEPAESLESFAALEPSAAEAVAPILEESLPAFGFDFDVEAPTASSDPVNEPGAITDFPGALGAGNGDDEVKVIGSLSLGVRLFNVYLNEADEWSRRLNHELTEWELEHLQPLADSPAALAHSLAGASAAVGFESLSDLARALEHALDTCRAHALAGRPALPEEAALFVEAADDIRRLLHQFAAGFLKTATSGLVEALNSYVHQQATVPLVVDGLEDGLFGEGFEAAHDFSDADWPIHSAEPAATPDLVLDFDFDLPDNAQGGAPQAAVESAESLELIESIDSSERLGAEPSIEVAEPTEAADLGPDFLDAESEFLLQDDVTATDDGVAAEAPPSADEGAHEGPLDDAVVGDALPDAVDAIDTSDPTDATGTNPTNHSWEATERSDALDAPLPNSRDELEVEPPEATPVVDRAPDLVGEVPSRRADTVRAQVQSVDDDIDDVDTLDADLFPIFEEEAQELLPRLGAALRQWVAKPGNAAARDEVLRTLHTLKGSARLAGALRLGEMAHRMETQAERLGSAVSEGALIEPLLGSFDGIAARFEDLCQPDDVVVQHRVQTAVENPVPDVATLAPDEALHVGTRDDVGLSEVADGAMRSAADHAHVAAVLPSVALKAGSSASVRVRAELLDRLVNQTGEVMITRSRMEAELGQLRGSLTDLTGNLDRLRVQLRDIELQAESQMQSRLAQAKDSDQSFDPLEFDRFTRVQELTRMMAESVNDVATVQRNLQRAVEATEDGLVAQGRQTRELQRDLLRTRMVEFEGIADRLYRVVRLASKETGKQVRLDIEGGSIEMDRGVLDRMTPAFEHLLRNCVAHGIEAPAQREQLGKDVEGQITVTLAQDGNDVSVVFADDGAGLDLARIRARAHTLGLVSSDQPLSETEAAQLIFAPGLTTATEVTGLSGRGIGMDVVRAEVAALGGRIETQTKTGQGTAFRMVLPLTTAVTQVVMLRAGQFSLGVPSGLVEVVRRVTPAELAAAYDSGTLVVAGETVPFYWAGALLQVSLHSDQAAGRTLPVVIFRSASQRVALHVDEVLGNQEVVVKNLGPQLSRLPGLAAMTVLASGAVSLIYNPVALSAVYGDGVRTWRREAVAEEVRQQAEYAEQAAAQALLSAPAGVVPTVGRLAAPTVPMVLVVDDSITVRRVTQRLLQREGYRVVLASDGLHALEKLQEERPSVVLSDIEMPRMDGFDLVRNIRSDPRLAGLPVIMITSRIAEKHREHARELGVDHYLGKPYAEDELLALIQHHCAEQAAAV